MVTAFLTKLVRVTNDCSPEVAHWEKDGTRFVIRSSKEFGDILQVHYSSSLTTFVRQLHFYGFSKMEFGGGMWGFSHPDFVQGKPQLMDNIERKKPAPKYDDGSSPSEIEELKARVHRLEQVINELSTIVEARVGKVEDAVERLEITKLGEVADMDGLFSTHDLEPAPKKIRIEFEM